MKKSKFIEILYQQCVVYELEVEKIFEGLYMGLQGANTDIENNKSVCDEKSCDDQKHEEINPFHRL